MFEQEIENRRFSISCSNINIRLLWRATDLVYRRYTRSVYLKNIHLNGSLTLYIYDILCLCTKLFLILKLSLTSESQKYFLNPTLSLNLETQNYFLNLVLSLNLRFLSLLLNHQFTNLCKFTELVIWVSEIFLRLKSKFVIWVSEIFSKHRTEFEVWDLKKYFLNPELSLKSGI